MKKRKLQEIQMIDDEYHGQPWAIIIIGFVIAGVFTAGVLFIIWLIVHLLSKI